MKINYSNLEAEQLDFLKRIDPKEYDAMHGKGSHAKKMAGADRRKS